MRWGDSRAGVTAGALKYDGASGLTRLNAPPWEARRLLATRKRSKDSFEHTGRQRRPKTIMYCAIHSLRARGIAIVKCHCQRLTTPLAGALMSEPQLLREVRPAIAWLVLLLDDPVRRVANSKCGAAGCGCGRTSCWTSPWVCHAGANIPPEVHRITSLACSKTDWGIARPMALAVLRLITNSNVVGCSIGRSPGFAPLSILSTYAAARRH